MAYEDYVAPSSRAPAIGHATISGCSGRIAANMAASVERPIGIELGHLSKLLGYFSPAFPDAAISGRTQTDHFGHGDGLQRRVC